MNQHCTPSPWLVGVESFQWLRGGASLLYQIWRACNTYQHVSNTCCGRFTLSRGFSAHSNSFIPNSGQHNSFEVALCGCEIFGCTVSTHCALIYNSQLAVGTLTNQRLQLQTVARQVTRWILIFPLGDWPVILCGPSSIIVSIGCIRTTAELYERKTHP